MGSKGWESLKVWGSRGSRGSRSVEVCRGFMDVRSKSEGVRRCRGCVGI